MIRPLSALFLLGAALTQPAAGGDTEADGAGARLFRFHCASCHGADGRGDGPVASALVDRPADLTDLTDADGRFRREAVRAALEGRITAHGPSEMPVWGPSLSPLGRDSERPGEKAALLADLLEYLESIQRSASDDVDLPPSEEQGDST